jgi:uncharacterized protein
MNRWCASAEMASDTENQAGISAELLALLRCPETMQPLAPAPAEVLARVAREGLRDRSGAAVAPLEAGLIREDGAVLYPVRGGIPILLVEQAVALR